MLPRSMKRDVEKCGDFWIAFIRLESSTYKVLFRLSNSMMLKRFHLRLPETLHGVLARGVEGEVRVGGVKESPLI